MHHFLAGLQGCTRANDKENSLVEDLVASRATETSYKLRQGDRSEE